MLTVAAIYYQKQMVLSTTNSCYRLYPSQIVWINISSSPLLLHIFVRSPFGFPAQFPFAAGWAPASNLVNNLLIVSHGGRELSIRYNVLWTAAVAGLGGGVYWAELCLIVGSFVML